MIYHYCLFIWFKSNWIICFKIQREYGKVEGNSIKANNKMKSKNAHSAGEYSAVQAASTMCVCFCKPTFKVPCVNKICVDIFVEG